jgi:hypothetical protein
MKRGRRDRWPPVVRRRASCSLSMGPRVVPPHGIEDARVRDGLRR